jgi:hypothetical protein
MTRFEVFSKRYQELTQELEDALEYATVVRTHYALDKVINTVAQLSALKVPVNKQVKI